MDPRAIASVLSEIAETASETLELQDVFGRVAASIRRLIPLDNMGVVRILDGRFAVLHAATVQCQESGPECTEPEPLTSWSERLRPRPESIPRVDDAPAELDPAFPIDAMVLERGVRSAMWEPFQSAGVFSGGVWVSAQSPRAFTDEHQAVLRPIAALLGSAVEHWRIWDAERRRRERLDRLEVSLATLASALDVREIFAQISSAVEPVLPHQLLALTELDRRAGSVRLVAHAGSYAGPVPDRPVMMTPEEMGGRLLESEIVRDIPAEVAGDTERERLMLSTGLRSFLRVPVRLWGEVRGSLVVMHAEASRYSADELEVARRLADRIALGLSHHRLAEEARLAIAERERAERLEATVATLTRELEGRERARIVGRSRHWSDVLLQVGRVAPSETTVLITGESGTGKEVVARLLHAGSARAAHPFVAINCAALPEHLLESELFGHERGAFTGAVAAKVGRLEQAAGGTLFLDEIGEMSPLVQAKLLRVLQEREFQRLGSARTLRADVRILAATNRDLVTALARGQFRDDLYYRLNVFQIHIAPLRERPEDILPLAEAFLEDLGRTMGRPAAGISRDARAGLLEAAWPGNARELRNAIERAILLCDGGLITREHLPAAALQRRPLHNSGPLHNGRPRADRAADALQADPAQLPPGGVDLGEVDRTYVEQALHAAQGNKSKAARLLGLTRAQLYSRLEKYKLHS